MQQIFVSNGNRGPIRYTFQNDTQSSLRFIISGNVALIFFHQKYEIEKHLKGRKKVKEKKKSTYIAISQLLE